MVSDHVLGAAIARLVRKCRPGELSAKRIRYALEDKFACGDLAARIDFIRDQIQCTLSTMDNPSALLAPSPAHAQPSASSPEAPSSQHAPKMLNCAALSRSSNGSSAIPAPTENSSKQSGRSVGPVSVKVPAPSERHCDVCLKPFQSYHKLVLHYRIHTGERPYVCTLCGHATAQKSNLGLHMQRKHKIGRPY
jgi:uncharacterized Zn-finger protein